MMGIEIGQQVSLCTTMWQCALKKMMWPAKMREAGDANIATFRTKDPFPSFRGSETSTSSKPSIYHIHRRYYNSSRYENTFSCHRDCEFNDPWLQTRRRANSYWADPTYPCLYQGTLFFSDTMMGKSFSSQPCMPRRASGVLGLDIATESLF